MQSLKDFFAKRAHVFRDGDIEVIADTFALPVTVHIGEVTRMFRSAGEVTAMLRAYRENLLLEGYDRSECEVLHVEQSDPTKAQVFVEWTSYRADGTLLTQVQTSYFCARDGLGQWRISMIECLADPNSRFWRGALVA